MKMNQLVVFLLCMALVSHEGKGSYCMSTDCTTGSGGLSLYLRVCCIDSNLGQAVTIREPGINRYILCPKVTPKSCPEQKENTNERTAVTTNSSSPCMTLLQEGYNTSGVYTVNPDENTPFDVYCDMETDGGGWTVFQRRQDGSVSFDRNWTDYENGFGNLTSDFWLGLDKIHRLTKEGSKTLRIDLKDFSDNTAFAKYATFSVGDNTTQYTLSVINYSGTANEGAYGFLTHNGRRFATRDNDILNCVGQYNNGGWWYTTDGQCFNTILNGVYGQSIPTWRGIYWYHWTDSNNLKYTDMKFR